MIELRQEHPLEGLLKLAGLARSTFYYQQKVQQSVDKYVVLKSRICSIFDEHKGRYGYRRITAAVQVEARVGRELDDGIDRLFPGDLATLDPKPLKRQGKPTCQPSSRARHVLWVPLKTAISR